MVPNITVLHFFEEWYFNGKKGQKSYETRLEWVKWHLVEKVVQSDIDDKAKERDQISKFKGKLYSDDKRNAKPTEIEVGKEVLLKQRKLTN